MLVNRHLQLFIKRFRKYVSKNYNEKIRYYAIGEYGTQSLRPHWHILFFYSSSQLARDFENVHQFGTESRPIQTPIFLRSLWKFGHIDSKQTAGAINNPVASQAVAIQKIASCTCHVLEIEYGINVSNFNP